MPPPYAFDHDRGQANMHCLYEGSHVVRHTHHLHITAPWHAWALLPAQAIGCNSAWRAARYEGRGDHPLADVLQCLDCRHGVVRRWDSSGLCAVRSRSRHVGAKGCRGRSESTTPHRERLLGLRAGRGIEFTAPETGPVVLPAPARSRPRSSCPGGRSACPTWRSAAPPGRGHALLRPRRRRGGDSERCDPRPKSRISVCGRRPEAGAGRQGAAVPDGVGDEFTHDQF